MDIMLLAEMALFAVFASFLYTLLGVIPGTDETAVLAPVTLALALFGVKAEVLVCFFIAAIVAKMITGNIPVAVAGIPSGVMSAPMIPAALKLKKAGLTTQAIRKMSAGSVVGTLLAIPLSFILAGMLAPLSDLIRENAMLVFMLGTIFLALMAKNKLICLVSIIPLAILIQSLNHFYWGMGVLEDGKTVFISFFLAITIGPMLINLLELMIPGQTQQQYYRDEYSQIDLIRMKQEKNLNPLTILTPKEMKNSVISTMMGVVTFFMSPVGMMILIGETLSRRIEDEIEQSAMIVTIMNALNNGTYVAGILIPLIALGIPLSPVSIGPGNALFNAPPVYTIENNIHHQLTTMELVLPVLIGAIIAIVITYILTVKYANEITSFIFSRIPHEAILGLFFGLAILLAFLDAGVLNIFGMLLLSIFSGVLNRWGVNYGVQFMVLYASSGIVNLLI